MRAMPATSGFGFWGSGPRFSNQALGHTFFKGLRFTSDQAMEGLPWTSIHFACQGSLLDFGFDANAEGHT